MRCIGIFTSVERFSEVLLTGKNWKNSLESVCFLCTREIKAS